MNNAINNQFKMKMGSKQKDTEGNFSEKDTALMKQAPLLNISSVLKDDPGAPGDKFKAMGDAFDAGKDSGEGEELMGALKGDSEPQGGYAEKFAKMGEEAGEKKKGLGSLIGKAAGFIGLG